MVTLVIEGLLNEFLKTLNVLLIDNLGEDTQSICFHNIVV